MYRGLTLIWVNARELLRQKNFVMDWKPIATAPYDRDLEVAFVDPKDGAHALVFACRRTDDGWIDAKTRKPIIIQPTHWREWPAGVSPNRHT